MCPVPKDLSQVRKELHRIPEPAFQEIKTRELLLGFLSDLQGTTVHQLKNSTGILVEYTQVEGPYLLFRADMDGLPVAERTGADFSSQHQGWMHACGHDVHMTVLLGLISRVVELQYKANLLFLFQPAEEGMGGAESVLAEGLLQTFDISRVFALHVSGILPVHTVSAKPGIFFAIPQEFDVQFTGLAAHAAFPDKGRNALQGGLDFCARMDDYIALLQQTEPAIFNIGVFQSGVIRNIIPEHCLLQGTHRTLSRARRDMLNDAIDAAARAVAEAYNLKYQVDMLCTYDPVINDADLYQQLKSACRTEGIEFRESGIQMTGEDFGFFTSRYPGLLFWLGAGELYYDLHSDKFLPDEQCIPVGINLFFRLIEHCPTI